MLFVLKLFTNIVPFLVLVLGAGWGNPYKGCSEIVQKSCNFSPVAMQSPQKLYRACAAAVPFLSVRVPNIKGGALCIYIITHNFIFLLVVANHTLIN